MAFGFNNKPLRKSSIGGDFDGDGVKNRKDCRPLNYKKQDGGMSAKDYAKMIKEQKKLNLDKDRPDFADPFTAAHPDDRWDPSKGDYGN